MFASATGMVDPFYQMTRAISGDAGQLLETLVVEGVDHPVVAGRGVRPVSDSWIHRDKLERIGAVGGAAGRRGDGIERVDREPAAERGGGQPAGGETVVV